MNEIVEYSISNPNTSLIGDSWERAKRLWGYNYLWTPSQYKVVVKPEFVYNYSGEGLPANMSPLLLTVKADYNLFGHSEPWETKEILVIGLLLESATRSFTLQNRQFGAHVRIFSTEYHLEYTDVGLGIAERSSVTDDLITDNMQYFNEIGTHQIDERRVRTLDFTIKGFPEKVSWVDTLLKYLPFKDPRGVLIPPELAFEQIHQNFLVPADGSKSYTNGYLGELDQQKEGK